MKERLFYLYCLSSQSLTLPNSILQKKIEDIHVVYQLVSDEVFGQDTIGQYLKDVHWVTEKVQLHSQIVQLCHEQATVIPMRFPVIFESWENVTKEMLANMPYYAEALQTIKGKSEWTLRVYVDEKKLQQVVATQNEHLGLLQAQITEASEGKAFILKKRYENELQEATDAWLIQHINQILEVITPHIANVLTKPISYQKEDTDTHKIVSKYVLLIMNDRQDAFLNILQEEQKRLASQGIVLQCTGGWAIYNFLPYA